MGISTHTPHYLRSRLILVAKMGDYIIYTIILFIHLNDIVEFSSLLYIS